MAAERAENPKSVRENSEAEDFGGKRALREEEKWGARELH
jgi:hypothetical protein